MPAVIHRSVTDPKRLKILANESASEPCDITSGATAAIFVPIGWNAADITFLTCYYEASYVLGENRLASPPAYALLRDENGDALRIKNIVAGAWYVVPAKVMTVKYVKLQSTNAGLDTPTNQADVRELLIAFKS